MLPGIVKDGSLLLKVSLHKFEFWLKIYAQERRGVEGQREDVENVKQGWETCGTIEHLMWCASEFWFGFPD